MKIIRNKLNQRLMIHIKGNRYVELFPQGTATVTEEEIRSSHLQNLISRGDLDVSDQPIPEPTEEKVEKPKPAKKKIT